MRLAPRIIAFASVAIAGLIGTEAYAADGDPGVRHETVKLQFEGALPNVPGKKLTSVVVTYAPGAKSSPHKHAGSVFAYVLSGTIRSENTAIGPAKVYHAGESFFEPPGSVHLVSENASTTESASLLAVFVADADAVLTVPAK